MTPVPGLRDPAPTSADRIVSNWRLLYRLIVRPMVREPLRSGVTVLCVSVGVAVVVAIDLAGEASAGSFRSSMESLQGGASYEISKVGGIPDEVFGDLSRIREPLRFLARVEGYVSEPETGERFPLFGVDVLGDEALRPGLEGGPPDLGRLSESRQVWISRALRQEAGGPVRLVVGDTVEEFEVAGVIRESVGGSDSLGPMALMDIALAQRVLGRRGLLDRIYVETPEGRARYWESLIRSHLPPGTVLHAIGVRSRESRKLLTSFRWNLRVLSYIALIVGAFLVYNTVSVSVVRRRTMIGVARALGMPRGMVRAGFLAEGLLFGIVGTALGLATGKVLAVGAVELMGQTVQSLYLSSAPGEIAIRPWTAFAAVCAGVGASALSAWWPASEAATVPPTDAMSTGRIDFATRVQGGSWAIRGLACAAVSIGLCFAPAWDRVPFAAYAAALGLIASATMLVPQAAVACVRLSSRPLLRVFGVASMLGARSLSSSLARTAVIVAALSTATAMMVSVAIMVGSMRETLLVWIDSQLQADLYIQPERRPGEGDLPTMDGSVALTVESLPAVDAVDRYRRYAISYGGLPATLALADFRVLKTRSEMRMIEGADWTGISDLLMSTESVIVSETFSSKHDVRTGDVLSLPIGDGAEGFEIVGVYPDYSAESGYILGDRGVLARHLPDARLTGCGVYLVPGADIEAARSEVVRALAGRTVVVARNRELRENATAVFDRTFAITYALEAVAVFVAILGMAGSLITLVIDRRGELGVLRALGGSREQIRSLVIAQAGMLGIMSNLIGLLLGCALSVILVKVINKQSFGWTIQFHWPVGFLLLAIAVIFAASLAAGLYPARIASSSDPGGTLREA